MRPLFPNGLLVALEGIDGCGKSSVALALTQHCGEHGVLCALSKEPTAVGPGAEMRRATIKGRLSPEEEYQSFLADRRAHVARTVAPTLAAGGVVILDRYYWSSAAYQGIRGIDPARIIEENERFAPRPHLVLLIDVEPSVALGRIHRRGDLPNTFEALRDLERVRDAFLNVHALTDYGVRIDAARPARAVAADCMREFLRVARMRADDVDATFFA